jgi:DNA-binding MarR family transcriptional regulator
VAVPQPGSNDRHEEYQAISSKLRDLALTLTGLGSALAARLNLNRNDLRALDILIEQRGMTAGQLASQLKLTTGAITGVIDRLELAGHAVRMHDDEDRRKVVVRATRKAIESRDEALGSLRSDVTQLLDGYSDDELDLINRFLEKVGQLITHHADQLSR